MSDPLTHSRALPDHMTPDGDVVVGQVVLTVDAEGAMEIASNVADRDWLAEALRQASLEMNGAQSVPSKIVAGTVNLYVFASGAMQIDGKTADRKWLATALNQASEEIKKRQSSSTSGMIIPASDSDMAKFGKSV